MTSLEFARATGWPEDEWMDLRISEAAEILALYGLKFSREVEMMVGGYDFGFIDGFLAGWNDALRTKRGSK